MTFKREDGRRLGQIVEILRKRDPGIVFDQGAKLEPLNLDDLAKIPRSARRYVLGKLSGKGTAVWEIGEDGSRNNPPAYIRGAPPRSGT
jgi:hypothetical protein